MNLLAGYRALQRWVKQERRRLERSEERPSQRYLRRSRLVDDIDPLTLGEFLRELRALAVPEARKRGRQDAKSTKRV